MSTMISTDKGPRFGIQTNQEADADYLFPLWAVPKQRHNDNHQTPLKTKRYEELIAELTRQQKSHVPIGRLLLGVTFGVKDFKSDISNLVKSIEDGMQHIAFGDDQQIDALVAYRYKSKDPEIHVQLYEI